MSGTAVLLIAITVARVGFEALGYYAVPLLAIAVWYFGWLHQTFVGEAAPERDPEPDPVNITGGPPFTRLLAVVPLQQPHADPIDAVLWLPPLKDFTGHILSAEHILGYLKKKLADGGALEPSNFVEDEFFVQFLHEFLQRELPGRPRFQAESRQTKDGWVRCVDERVLDFPVPAPGGEPDEEDIFGRFHVQGGVIEPGSYERNRAHRLFTNKGLFRLDFALRERLKDEVIARHAFNQAGQAPTSDLVM
jgi:hypothetical protein